MRKDRNNSFNEVYKTTWKVKTLHDEWPVYGPQWPALRDPYTIVTTIATRAVLDVLLAACLKMVEETDL